MFAKENRLTFDNYKSRFFKILQYTNNKPLANTISRYPRILLMWCDRGQEAFVNVDLFQTTTNYSSFISLWLKMSFHRIFFF